MKCENTFKKIKEEDAEFFSLSIIITPETEEEKQFLEEWDEDQYIEKWIDTKGSVRLML